MAKYTETLAEYIEGGGVLSFGSENVLAMMEAAEE